jgi:hypothetical protein
MECSYCKNTFSSKSVLNNHMKTAKYCLKLQNKEKSVNQDNIRKCNGCGKIFTTKFNFQRHIQNCDKIENMSQILALKADNKNLIDKLDEKESLIDDLRLQINKLQDKLENIAIKAVQRPTTTNMNKTQINNYIQKMEPISSEHMLEQSSNLTLEHIQKGASGYAEYALEYPLKERTACVDYSRRKMKFKDKEGNLITDPEMVKLAPMFFNSIKEKSSEIVYSQNDPNMDSVMFETVAKLFNMNADVKNGADGIKSEFYHDFIKHVCSGSVVE